MAVNVERVGNRIHAEIPWNDGKGPIFAKKILGAKWSKAKKRWTYPLDMDTCVSLREVFGNTLHIGPLLWAWAKAERERTSTLRAVLDTPVLGGHEPVELLRIRDNYPLIYKAMQARGYQTVAAKFGAIAKQYILADEPGLGKTLETFGALIEGSAVPGDVLVIAPKTALRATWAHEIEKWLGDEAEIYVADGPRAKRLEAIEFFQRPNKDALSWRFLVINPEMVRYRPADKDAIPPKPEKIEYPQLFEKRWDAIIGDEVHRYLMRANPNSKNVSAVGYGFQHLKTYGDDGMKIALTGTPMKGKPKNLWGTLQWIRPKEYTSRWRWMEKFYKSIPNRYSQSGKEYIDEFLEGAEDKLVADLYRVMIRRTKNELHKLNPAWAPPPKSYFNVWVDMDPKQRKLYDEVLNEASITMGRQVLTVNGILAQLTRLKQIAGAYATIGDDRHLRPCLPSGKLDWLVDDFLPSRGITGDASEDGTAKVVIASQYTQLINMYSYELERRKIRNFVLTGETTSARRNSYIDSFQNNPNSPRVFLLNTNAGGVSVTLDVADDMVILDETWVPDEQEQVEDRIHRTSRTDHFVNIYYLRSRGTIEEEIMSTNELHDETQKIILDGKRGVDYAKRKFNTTVK